MHICATSDLLYSNPDARLFRPNVIRLYESAATPIQNVAAR